MPNVERLSRLLSSVREWLRRPGNDYTWSSWRDDAHALQEIDTCLAYLASGKIPSTLSTIFAPTGPLQELALSSGWGDEFLALVDRFDAAMAESTGER